MTSKRKARQRAAQHAPLRAHARAHADAHTRAAFAARSAHAALLHAAHAHHSVISTRRATLLRQAVGDAIACTRLHRAFSTARINALL